MKKWGIRGLGNYILNKMFVIRITILKNICISFPIFMKMKVNDSVK